MRSILVLLVILIFLIPFGIPVLIIEWIISRFNKDLANRSTLAMIKGVLHILIFLSGIKLTVIGRENIPEDRPVLYVSNHRSYFDIVVGYPQVKGLCGFVSKQEMGRIPLLNLWMKNLNCLLLDRSSPRAGMQTIMDASRQITEGISMWICPEGTRIQNDGVEEFKGGSFRIAEKANAPVIPVAITHTEDVFEKHAPWIHATQVTIEFAPPIETADMDRAARKELPELARKTVEDMYRKNL